MSAFPHSQLYTPTWYIATASYICMHYNMSRVHGIVSSVAYSNDTTLLAIHYEGVSILNTTDLIGHAVVQSLQVPSTFTHCCSSYTVPFTSLFTNVFPTMITYSMPNGRFMMALMQRTHSSCCTASIKLQNPLLLRADKVSKIVSSPPCSKNSSTHFWSADLILFFSPM